MFADKADIVFIYPQNAIKILQCGGKHIGVAVLIS